MRILSVIIAISLFSCKQASTRSETTDAPTPVVTLPVNNKAEIDSNEIAIIKKDTIHINPVKITSKTKTRKEKQISEGEGVSDDKLNGEPIIVQLELSDKVLSEYPDTIKSYLKSMYLGSESRFPRSIADNFEKGISTERIHYPKLNYLVQIFADDYAKKPYRTFGYSVRKEYDGNLIVE